MPNISFDLRNLPCSAPGSFFVDNRPGQLFIFSNSQDQFHMSESVFILHATKSQIDFFSIGLLKLRI